MKNLFLAIAILVALVLSVPATTVMGADSSTGGGEINGNIKVEVAAIATGIEDRSPVGVGETFSHDIEKLYCYTKITGLDVDDVVQHVWYWGDKEMARVDLKVRPPAWRTWSSKRIIRVWKGEWRVDVVARGQVLKSLDFVVNKGH